MDILPINNISTSRENCHPLDKTRFLQENVSISSGEDLEEAQGSACHGSHCGGHKLLGYVKYTNGSALKQDN